ncbi:MAG: hypothetical protein LBB73_03545, partial [Dysgonamonadaceae bacterium]|nr:hypothetical protein [Dysgonamonadaceae bacterium]
SSIASVVDGIITACAPGEVIITVTTINGIFKDSCKITVKPENNVPALHSRCKAEHSPKISKEKFNFAHSFIS